MYAQRWLTNQGPLVQALERRLAEVLGVPYIVVVANGTMALQMAYKLLKLQGDVITTPLSFVATPNSLAWEGVNVRFADILPSTSSNGLTLDPQSVEACLTPDTRAIVPVHIFGQPCDVEGFAHLARKHDLKIIYDAAQAFGLRHQGQSILNHGDISVLSFHATKIFHTTEGGALVMHDKALYEQALYFRSHGRIHANETPQLGINAKLSELHAAMGHCILDDLPKLQTHHQNNLAIYHQRLKKHRGLRLPAFDVVNQPCNIYLPVVFETSEGRQRTESAFNKAGISLRRYFDPPLHHLPHLLSKNTKNTPIECTVAEALIPRLACLPMSPHVGPDFIHQVCDWIDQVLKN
jgi:dTDP-4-amino-4,6-dideoxygalactose transaminase